MPRSFNMDPDLFGLVSMCRSERTQTQSSFFFFSFFLMVIIIAQGISHGLGVLVYYEPIPTLLSLQYHG